MELFFSSKALELALKANEPDIILIDFHLGKHERSGVEVARAVRKKYPKTVTMMYTAANDVKTVVSGFLAGIDHYISKETDLETLPEAILRAYETAKLTSARGGPDVLARLNQVHGAELPPLIGNTMLGVASKLLSISQSSVETLHVYGESGTGKDVVASFLREISPKSAPFIAVNCAEIPPTLFESTLFGHKKGAFTGAADNRVGLIEAANGGWLFLDEIATLPLHIQAGLLRVIGNREIRRVGETDVKKVKFRLISASNVSLEKLVKQGSFREDLWNRIRDPMIELPPLRDRGQEEIGELIEHFRKSIAGGPFAISPGLSRILKCHDWRDGNVRDMERLLTSMSAFAPYKLLTEQHIPAWFWKKLGQEVPMTGSQQDDPYKVIVDISETLDFEILTQTLFNQTVKNLQIQHNRKLRHQELAQMLRLSPNTITKRMRVFNG